MKSVFKVDANNLNKYKRNQLREIREVLAEYDLPDSNRALRLETNGDNEEIYLEIVDYLVEGNRLFEQRFSDPIHEVNDDEEIKELFLDWIKQTEGEY